MFTVFVYLPMHVCLQAGVNHALVVYTRGYTITHYKKKLEAMTSKTRFLLRIAIFNAFER
jgi:hypothetical protein